MTFKAIENAVMKLPTKARSKLAAALISSLEEEGDPTVIERMWVKEAERRYRAFKAGRTSATPANVAIAAARAALA